MSKMTLHVDYEEFSDLEELSSDQKKLVLLAIEVARDAYAPYSGFYVGAAALVENGEILTGNNQENAAYPSGLCAERVALFYAGSKYPGLKVLSIAIAAIEDGELVERPVSPCGGCRQVMHETELRANHPVEIILYGKEKIRVIKRAADLLPLPFAFKKNN